MARRILACLLILVFACPSLAKNSPDKRSKILPRIVIAVMDEQSEKQFKLQGKITVQQILSLANKEFRDQGVRTSFDLKTLKIIRGQIKTPCNAKDKYKELGAELNKFLAKYNRPNLDAMIFFQGHVKQGNGLADRSDPANGQGYIFIGTGRGITGNKNYNLRIYSRVLMHEQGHLYGAGHSFNPFSIMFFYSNLITFSFIQFDRSSLVTINSTIDKILNKQIPN